MKWLQLVCGMNQDVQSDTCLAGGEILNVRKKDGETNYT